MLHQNIKVKVPEKCKVIKQRECCYVYHILDSVYDQNRQFNVEKRVCIGKLIDGNKDTEYMYPNDRYPIYYGDIEETAEPNKCDCISIGATLVLYRIMGELGLEKILNEVYQDDANKIMDLINYLIIEETCTMQHYAKYAWNHFTLDKGGISDSTISRFFAEGIKKEQVDAFLDKWNNAHKKDRIYISYDSTNINTKANEIDYAEYGYAKDDEDFPQINLSYAIDHDDATPLFYELYPGSIVDVSQVKYMVKIAKRYGYGEVGLILDRGYYSYSNIKEFDKNGINFLMMVKTNIDFAKNALKENRPNLVLGNENYIPEYNIYGKTVIGHLSINDEKKRYIHLYYDNIRASEERNNFLKNICDMEKRLDKKIEEKAVYCNTLKEYTKYFNLKEDQYGYLIGYKRKDQTIKDVTDLYGFFVIVTSEKMTAGEAINIYRKRDSVEKLFRALKTGFEYDNVKVHTTTSLESKTHVVFLASIVRNRLLNILKDVRDDDKKNYTVPAAIKELDKVNVLKSNDGKYRRKYGLTKIQKRICDGAKVNDKFIDKIVRIINGER